MSNSFKMNNLNLKDITLWFYHTEKFLNIRISEKVKPLCLRTSSSLSAFSG